jgi:hypothetical protein
MEAQNIQISASDSACFNRLTKRNQQIILVIKSINSRPHKGKEFEPKEEDEE